jgi:hypothetical protein
LLVEDIDVAGQARIAVVNHRFATDEQISYAMRMQQAQQLLDVG